MNTPRVAGASMIMLLAVAACDSLLTRPSLYGAVDVTVTQPDGTAISGASLVLYTFQRPMAYATTDASGAYRFTTVPEGLYGVAAAPPPGYASVTDTAASAAWDYVDQLSVRSGTAVAARLHFRKTIASSSTPPPARALIAPALPIR
jgi:hypothetical protein